MPTKMFEKTKQKLHNFKNYLKEGWFNLKADPKGWLKKQAVKIGVAIGAITLVALAVGMGGNGEVPFKMFNLQKIEFPYTDENVGEDIIIRTDRETYGGILETRRATIYAMIEVPKTQKVNAYLFFSQDNRKITELYYLYDNPNFSTSTYDCSYWNSTTSQQIQKDCVQINNPDEWVEIPLDDFDQTEYDQLTQNISVKDKKGFKAKKKGEYLVLKGTYYLKAVIEYPIGTHDEFFVEIIGDSNSYGMLDPTILSDPYNFNSMGDGTLNATDSWTGDVDYKIQGTTYFDDGGTKAIKVGAGDKSILKAGSKITPGKITVYMRQNNVANKSYFYLQETATAGDVWIRMFDGKFEYYPGSYTQFGTYTANTWHSVEIEWQGTGGSSFARARVDGGAWTNGGVFESFGNDWTVGLEEVRLRMLSGDECYFDYVAEDPYVPPVAPERRRSFNFD